ncbi:YqcC family protein [Endozoicomonas numazuensis]|uniref:Glyoxalase I n=1 Tax=Endozoicomonas numazuensis TaxID=1137799 RepID=A0A081NIA0_9GAMM|nr:YqcC family protein [Endozoicomonas numazuensis]KEQ18173.1 glyoxalase I [Endozoicomonas numazuensis]
MSTEVRALLVSLEEELKRLNCWQSMPPSAEAMASTTPFCMDTMGFTQWLQWLFIPRVSAILDQGAALPKGANIKPYAEEALVVEKVEATQLLVLVERFDQLMN